MRPWRIAPVWNRAWSGERYRVESSEVFDRTEDAVAVRDRLNGPPLTEARERTDPCPVCGDTGGFHLDEPHEAAVARIPAHLMRRTASSLREDRRAEKQAAYRAWLDTQGRTAR